MEPARKSKRFALPAGWPVKAALIGLITCIGMWAALRLGYGPTVSAQVTANFSGLMDTQGRSVDATALAGRYKLVAFGYTACPEACPATLTKLHAVLNTLSADKATLTPIFITLDPGHDTAEVLEAYVRHFDPRIVGLTGDLTSLQQSAAQLGALPGEPGAAQTPDGGPNHAVRLYLLSPQNTLLRTYEIADPTGLIASDVQRRLAPTS